jgi:hypothetical protein
MLWHILRYRSRICPEGLRKQVKESVRISTLWTEIGTLDLQNHWTATICSNGFVFYSHGMTFNTKRGPTILCFLLFGPLFLHKRTSGFLALYCVCVCVHFIFWIRWQLCNILLSYTPVLSNNTTIKIHINGSQIHLFDLSCRFRSSRPSSGIQINTTRRSSRLFHILITIKGISKRHIFTKIGVNVTTLEPTSTEHFSISYTQ